ncbi:hypothetical protein ACFPRL_07690 [Pseudoclavibacter helvolus]
MEGVGHPGLGMTLCWAAAMFSDSSSPVNWVGKSPGGAIHVS